MPKRERERRREGNGRWKCFSDKTNSIEHVLDQWGLGRRLKGKSMMEDCRIVQKKWESRKDIEEVVQGHGEGESREKISG